MRAVSVKRARQMRLYVPLRNEFLETHQVCQFPLGCGQRATDVHHRKGRQGERLLDVRFFAASCRSHNEYAEVETGHALEIEWLLRVESA